MALLSAEHYLFQQAQADSVGLALETPQTLVHTFSTSYQLSRSPDLPTHEITMYSGEQALSIKPTANIHVGMLSKFTFILS